MGGAAAAADTWNRGERIIMASWIRADYQCSRHIANIALDASHVYAMFGANLTRLAIAEDPESIAFYCSKFFEIAEGGKYHGADIWRLFQLPDQDRWYVTICHPHCPLVEECREIPRIVLHATIDEIDTFRERLADFVHSRSLV